LAQRQGLTPDALGDLGEKLSVHIRDLANVKKNKFRPELRIRNLARLADYYFNKRRTIKSIELQITDLARLANYYASCLRDPERVQLIKNWTQWNNLQKIAYILKNPQMARSKLSKNLLSDTTALTFFFDHHDSFSASNGSTDEELAQRFEAFANRIRTKRALQAYIKSFEYKSVE
jgi:uncharacterized surface protein with fasciclin (FAS1) repeats